MEDIMKHVRMNAALLAGIAMMGCAASQAWAQDAAEGAKKWLSGELTPPKLAVKYDGEPITLRFSSFLSPAIKLVSDVWEPAIKRLEAESDGKIVVKTYWGGTLHGLREGFQAVREGVTDFTHCMTAFDPGHFDIFNALTIPFVFRDATVATMVSHAVYPEYLKQEYEARGVLLAHVTMTPPYNILTKKPVASPAEFDGMKVRIGGGLQSKVIASLGGVPVNISSRELFTGFQTGVIDGVVFHDAAFVSFRAADVGKYKTQLGLLNNSAEYCLSKKFYQGLPDDLKPVLARWMQVLAVAEAQLYYDGFGANARKLMADKGIEVVTPTDAQMAAWKAASQAAVEQYVATMKAKGHKIDALIEDMHALSKKYATMSSVEQMQSVMKTWVKKSPATLGSSRLLACTQSGLWITE
jgi:TRAP-type C4-dicarboxylate transport system substrate-binding protein